MRNLKMETHQSTTHKKTRQNKKSPSKQPKHPIICEDTAMGNDIVCLPSTATASKRYNHKSAHSKLLISGRGKQPTASEMKEIIAKLQKELRVQQNRKHRKEEQNRLLDGQQNNQTTRVLSPKHKQMTNSHSQHRLIKYGKKESLSLAYAETYRNVLSPTRFTKTKRKSALSSKLMKSTQDTFRMLKENKKNQRIYKNSGQVEDIEQYMLFEDGFIEIDNLELGMLNEKMKNHQQNLIHRVSTTERQNHLKQIVFVDYDLETDSRLSHYVQEDASEGDQQNYLRHQSELFLITEKSTNKKDLLQCVKRIQCWWRKILSKKKSNKQLISTGLQHEIPELNIQSQNSQVFDSQEMNLDLPSNSNRKGKEQPEKDSQSNGVENALEARVEAAKKQRQTHQSFLERLLQTKQITQEYFNNKKVKIQANYSNEIEEIERIKYILNENMRQIKVINQKINKDKLFFDSQLQHTLELSRLEDIFGTDSPRTNKKHGITPIPILPRDDIVNRQKSKGCHFAVENDIRSTLYEKTDEYNIELCNSDYFQEDLSRQPQAKQAQQSKNYQTYDASFKQLIDELKIRQLVSDQIEKRAAIQMGALSQQSEWSCEAVAIRTSLNSIHRFLLGFFKFYIYYYKDEFLRLINMPFGYNIDRRIKSIQGYEDENPFPEEDEDGVIYGLQSVISADILDEFYEKIYENEVMNTTQRASFQFEKIHNKAVFESFNQALNYFRPYYLINGPPYPWNNSEKALTFYFIAEQNIQEVFEKTQFKVLKWASSLCGIYVGIYSDYTIKTNEEQLSAVAFDEVNSKSCHPLVAEAREQRLSKQEKMEFIDNGYSWMSSDQEKTSICFEISQFLFTKVMEDMALQMNDLWLKTKKGLPYLF